MDNSLTWEVMEAIERRDWKRVAEALEVGMFLYCDEDGRGRAKFKPAGGGIDALPGNPRGITPGGDRVVDVPLTGSGSGYARRFVGMILCFNYNYPMHKSNVEVRRELEKIALSRKLL